jgi:hypothetical protein
METPVGDAPMVRSPASSTRLFRPPRVSMTLGEVLAFADSRPAFRRAETAADFPQLRKTGSHPTASVAEATATLQDTSEFDSRSRRNPLSRS